LREGREAEEGLEAGLVGEGKTGVARGPERAEDAVQ